MISKLLILFLLTTAFPQDKKAGSEWESLLDSAESGHEIIMLLIKQKRFDSVLEECKKLFSLKFPTERQHMVAESAIVISDALYHAQQVNLAHRTLDEAIKHVDRPQSKSDLYREKAYLYRAAGEYDKAMEYFKMSRSLEND